MVSLVRVKSTFEKTKINSSHAAYDYALPLFGQGIDVFESVFLVLLNRANKTIGVAEISKGGTAGTVADVKIIVKYAVDTLASGCILFHNHPGGNTQPSEQDKAITSKVKEALKCFDISLLDHVIVTSDNGFFSFADEGLI